MRLHAAIATIACASALLPAVDHEPQVWREARLKDNAITYLDFQGMVRGLSSDIADADGPDMLAGGLVRYQTRGLQWRLPVAFILELSYAIGDEDDITIETTSAMAGAAWVADFGMGNEISLGLLGGLMRYEIEAVSEETVNVGEVWAEAAFRYALAPNVGLVATGAYGFGTAETSTYGDIDTGGWMVALGIMARF